MSTNSLFRRVSVLSPSLMEFGVIPHDHWYQPSWIDEEKAEAARKKMEEDNVIYGGMSRHETVATSLMRHIR